MILITRWMQKVDIECLKMYKYTSTLAKSKGIQVRKVFNELGKIYHSNIPSQKSTSEKTSLKSNCKSYK